MTLTTDRGKTFKVNWAWAPVGTEESLMFELADVNAPLHEVVSDLEGCNRIHRSSEIEPPLEIDYDGYVSIKSVVCNFNKKTIQMTLVKQAS